MVALDIYQDGVIKSHWAFQVFYKRISSVKKHRIWENLRRSVPTLYNFQIYDACDALTQSFWQRKSIIWCLIKLFFINICDRKGQIARNYSLVTVRVTNILVKLSGSSNMNPANWLDILEDGALWFWTTIGLQWLRVVI